MTLREYLDLKEMTCLAFGRLIGVTQVSVGRYAKGERLPRKAIMARIIAATEGAVQPQDFFPGVA